MHAYLFVAGGIICTLINSAHIDDISYTFIKYFIHLFLLSLIMALDTMLPSTVWLFNPFNPYISLFSN